MQQHAKSSATRWLRIGLWSVGALVAVVLLAGLGLHLRLSQGPISIDFLVRPLEAAINRDIAPLRIAIGRTVMRYGERGFGFALRLNDIRVTDETGNAVAEAPFAAMALSTNALMQGSLAPSSIELLQPKMLLTVTPENGLSLRMARQAPIAPAASAEANGLEQDLTPQLTTDSTVAALPLLDMLNDVLGKGARAPTRTTYLQTVGVRDALIVLDYHGQRSIWGLPNFEARRGELASGSRPRLEARGAVVTGGGAFEIGVAVAATADQTYAANFEFTDLIPADIGQAIPPLAALTAATAPVSGKGAIEIAADGMVVAGEAELQSLATAISTAAPCAEPISLDGVRLGLRYSRASGAIDISPSSIATNIGRATLAGRVVPPGSETADSIWRYDLAMTGAALGTGDEGLEPVPIAGARLRGGFNPATRLLTFDRLHIPLGAGAVNIAGRSTAATGMVMEAVISKLDTGVLKRIWPACVAQDARAWVRRAIHSGVIEQASIKIATRPAVGAASQTPAQLTMQGGVSGLSFTAIENMPPVASPAARFQLTGGQYAVEAASSSLTLGPGRVLTIKGGRFAIPDILAPVPVGTFTGEISSTLEAAMEFLDRSPVARLRQDGITPPPLGGQQTSTWTVSLPLINALQREDIALAGTMKVRGLQSLDTKGVGGVAIKGGAVDVQVSSEAIAVTGDILLNGVDFKVAGSRPLGQRASDQSGASLTLSATLDDADRDQLGIAVNHMVRGDVPVTITHSPGAGTVKLAVNKEDKASAAAGAGDNRPWARVKADLSNAELVLDTMAWRKLPGSPASLSFDVVALPGDASLLRDFRLVGSDIGIGGELRIGRDRRLQSFSFPDFSIDVVSRLTLTGKMRADNVLEVRADGTTFDGRKLFRSLFSAGRVTERDLPAARGSEGLDLNASIGTMIGVDDVSLHQVTATLSRRKGKLTALNAQGTLDGGGSLAVGLTETDGAPRTMVAETKDAGRAFKLVGLYRNIEGGEASLKVDLDGDTALEKSGILWARRFVLLGDTVVDKVLTKAPGSDGPVLTERRKGPGKRARLEFQNMRVPFRVGQGKLDLGDSFINGPIIGATLRGTVDFERQQVRLAGTYVPLFGLNAMFAGVPLFGDLLVGRNGEGVFGITFGIEGAIDRPEVLVNPISLVAPGIFRQIFEFDTTTPRPVPPGRKKRQKSAQAGSSSSEPITAPTAGASIGEAMPAATGPSKPAKPVKKKPVPNAVSEDAP